MVWVRGAKWYTTELVDYIIDYYDANICNKVLLHASKNNFRHIVKLLNDHGYNL